MSSDDARPRGARAEDSEQKGIASQVAAREESRGPREWRRAQRPKRQSPGHTMKTAEPAPIEREKKGVEGRVTRTPTNKARNAPEKGSKARPAASTAEAQRRGSRRAGPNKSLLHVTYGES